MTTLSVMNSLQLIGGIILSFGYLFQIPKIIKTKSVRDFDRKYLGSIFIGIVLMEIYAVYMYFFMHTAGMFFVTNTASTILSGIEFGLVIAYWNHTQAKK